MLYKPKIKHSEKSFYKHKHYALAYTFKISG